MGRYIVLGAWHPKITPSAHPNRFTGRNLRLCARQQDYMQPRVVRKEKQWCQQSFPREKTTDHCFSYPSKFIFPQDRFCDIVILNKGQVYAITVFLEGKIMNYVEILDVLRGEFFDKVDKLSNLVRREVCFPNAPGVIKIAIGMRRTGKTTFLYQHIQDLLKSGVSKHQILYINCEDDRLNPLTTSILSDIIDTFYSMHPKNYDATCHLFFDEIQNIDNWPAIIRRLHDTKDVELYLSGSSAKLLSKEIATSLRGRSLSVEIWPFSFKEFLRSKKMAETSEFYDKRRQAELLQAFHQYLSQGGFPGLIHLEANVRQSTLQEYLQVAVYRDIVERHNIHNFSALKDTIQLMIHNTARPLAVNKLHGILKNQGISIAKESLYDYILYVEDAYLAFSVPLFSTSLKKTQANPKKIYAIDPGLIRATTLDFERDLGRLFENIVYLDLRRQGYIVSYYLTENRYEVDFFIQSKLGEKKLLQVAWHTDDEETRNREYRALDAAKSELGIPGEVMTLDSYLRCTNTMES